MESQSRNGGEAVETTTESTDVNSSGGNPNHESDDGKVPCPTTATANTVEGVGGVGVGVVNATAGTSLIKDEPSTIPVVRKVAWSSLSSSSSSSSAPSSIPKMDGSTITAFTKGSTKSISFADIVAEQSRDKIAALAAYGEEDVGGGGGGGIVYGSRSLADIEEEQKRLFSTLPQQQQQKQSSYFQEGDVFNNNSNYTEIPSSSSDRAILEEDDLDAEELRLMQIAMQQSLEVFNLSNHSNGSVSSNENLGMGDDESKIASKGSELPMALERTVLEEVPCVPDDDFIFSPPSDLGSSLSDTKVLKGDTNRCAIATGGSPTLSSKFLNDKHFSERTLRDIERTEVVVDNPHTDLLVMGHRRRLSSSSSHSRMSNSPRTARRTLPVALQSSHRKLSGSSCASASNAAFPALDVTARSQPSLEDTDERLLPPMKVMQTDMARRDSQLSDSGHGSPLGMANMDVKDGPGMGLMKVMAGPSLQVESSQHESTSAAASIPPAAAASAATVPAFGGLSEEETAAIEAALREADAQEEAESLQLALRIQQEELGLMQQQQQQQQEHIRRQQQTSDNVRVMTRAQLQAETARLHSHQPSSHSVARSSMGPTATRSDQPNVHFEDSVKGTVYEHSGQYFDDEEEDDDDFHHGYLPDEDETGFRMNSNNQQQWNRLDRSTIVGPNNEVRSKHDVKVQGQTNAQILDLETNDRGVRAHVGNQAFNSFRKTMKRTTKGVATHGTGRAGSDTDATRGKALDPHVRLEISRAVNRGLIERCNGAVKQGKEAIVYHANGGVGTSENHGFDVAVKVFKRIHEFRGRGEYVDGDPRYAGRVFRSLSDREQLELWTEKEYRNLVRAHRARVPVPTPLHYKDNVIFMRFMGTTGWPAPQIRQIDLRKESKKWDIMYAQVMESIRRLYVEAKLVHGDLSEYNILICPVFQVDHPISSVEDPSNELQTVIIDFGQAVDVRHPGSRNLLERDLNRVRDFFTRQGVKTLGMDESLEFVVEDFENRRDESSSEPSISSSQRSIVNA